MSIFKVNSTDYQSITLSTNPSRFYSSSSSGITGSLYVFPRRSKIEKTYESVEVYNQNYLDENNFNLYWWSLNSAIKSFLPITNNVFGFFDGYLEQVNNVPISSNKRKTLDIIRSTPPYYFTTGTLKKLAIKDNLSHYYRAAYPSAHWAYSNYHSLNFFSSPTVPTSSVLLYPNDNDGTIHEGYSTGRYALSGAFSFDFHINPRYQQLDSNGHFSAGTIFHLSSSYALSLVTGSQKDINGLPIGFRLQLQLSHSADIAPSLASHGSYPKDLVFLSDDNSLKWNNWHHVVVRWGTNLINQGTGSFSIDGVDKGTFVVPSGTVAPRSFQISTTKPHVPATLCVGNYYEGTNINLNRQDLFFDRSRWTEGCRPAKSSGFGGGNYNTPVNFAFNHPLQAELHDLSIKRFYVTDADIITSGSTGITNFKDVAFYVPPFFTMDSPIRTDLNRTYTEGVVYSPSYAASGITTTPFNLWLAYGTGGHYINTENFLKDFASEINPGVDNSTNLPLTGRQGNFPRQYNLSASLVPINYPGTANEILYNQPTVRKRNLTILPCDDGKFYPNYNILLTSSLRVWSPEASLNIDLNQNPSDNVYADDLFNSSPGFINLNFQNINQFNLIYSGSRFDSTIINDDQENEWSKDNVGFSPEKPTATATFGVKTKFNNLNQIVGNAIDPEYKKSAANKLFVTQSQIPLSISTRTQDVSSNQVVFFDISNLFYGTRILPGSFEITDSSLSGSGGAISMTIKDDGNGTLYRADSLTPHCKWNSVGTIFYNEGIVAIKSPHLYFFGKDQFELSFKGEQNLHILRIESLAQINHLNFSSNPTYKQVPSTNNPNEYDKNFVYITGINFHDDNLNVIMKTQLAQPIMKRHSDKIMFKVKYDF